MKWQFNNMAKSQAVEWQADEMARNGKLMKWQDDKTASWQKGKRAS